MVRDAPLKEKLRSKSKLSLLTVFEKSSSFFPNTVVLGGRLEILGSVMKDCFVADAIKIAVLFLRMGVKRMSSNCN